MSSARARALVFAWGPVLAYMGAIFAVSSLSELPVPRFPFRHFDKVAHFSEYLGLAFLGARATSLVWPTRSRWRTQGLAWLLAAAFGFSDEIHQAFVPNRSPDVLDWFADASGAFVGVLLFRLVLAVPWLSWVSRPLGSAAAGETAPSESQALESKPS